MKNINKIKNAALIALWSALAATAVVSLFQNSKSSVRATGAKEDGLSVTACGDVMIQNSDTAKSMDDSRLMSFMGEASAWFKSAHVGFVNLEGPIGGREPKRCSGEHCYRFNQGPLTAKALRENGINAASMANNHANDMGPSGQASTASALEREGIEAAGLFSQPAKRWMANGKSVELLAFTANGFAPDFRKEEAFESIRKAKERSDYVIVSAHMGCEGESCANLKGGKEIYLGEDRGDPALFGAKAVDAGADLVLGSGPHVPRGFGLRRGRLIAYSLGNCAVGPGISTAGKAGWAPVLRVELDSVGKLREWDVGSFVGNGAKMAAVPEQKALKWMLQATGRDSGEQVLKTIEELRRVRVLELVR